MKKFLVLFLSPVSVLEEWMNKPKEERKAEEDRMSVEWKKWIKDNEDSIIEAPAGAGKTKTVNQKGIIDTRNDVMMYAIVKANSHDEAAALFVNHTHLQIPEATIEIMEINPLTGMA